MHLYQYSRSYYRATWIATGFDAGFATAMNIKAKWLRDLCSVLFSLYYIVYAHEADEKVRASTSESLRILTLCSFVSSVPFAQSRCSVLPGRKHPTHISERRPTSIDLVCVPSANSSFPGLRILRTPGPSRRGCSSPVPSTSCLSRLTSFWTCPVAVSSAWVLSTTKSD